jgi:hypothetical protein
MFLYSGILTASKALFLEFLSPFKPPRVKVNENNAAPR